MPGTIATISGTMLTPGVSRNGRLYTPQLIAAAAKRMQERLADTDALPITMRTHHDAGDDSARIVGRVTAVTVEEDGSATYTGDLYDTAHGRDIAALVTGKRPALRSVSIHGYWVGPVKRTAYEGRQVTTGDDLDIDSVDFTATPGVLGARIASATYAAQGTSESADRTAISESAEVTVEAVTEAATPGTRRRRQLAAQGKAMPDGSYPIRNKADLRKAIRAVGRGGADRDAIRRHILKRATALGLAALIPTTWKDDGAMTEAATRYSDVREYYPDGPAGSAGFCVDAYNGPVSLTLRACGIDPAELRVITAAAMKAACDALAAMDPDMDADIDVDGAPKADSDSDQAETAPATPAPVAEAAPAEPALSETTLPDPGEAAPITPEEEPAVSEPITQETAAPARSLTDDDITALGALFGAALKEHLEPVTTALKESRKRDKAKAAKETKPAAGAVAETAATPSPAADVVSERDALKAAIRNELREELLKEFGTPGRRGYRVGESEQGEDSRDELWAGRASALLGEFGVTPAPAA
ncbi:hypothetical protein ACFYUY_01340 [Kitasatospora sp. NPDC004745]|uniref:hypothetical protein n=1 Tax=Kitasatospora sp. NPDC004745 TaxID=3364019 RepID=UPI003698F78B